MTDYSELKRLAEAARDSIGMGLNAQILAVHAFEDQTSPDVVLGLIAAGERWREEWSEVCNENQVLINRNQALLEALTDAADEVESWGAYVSEYFKDKHDLAGTVARFRAAIALAEGKDI